MSVEKALCVVSDELVAAQQEIPIGEPDANGVYDNYQYIDTEETINALAQWCAKHPTLISAATKKVVQAYRNTQSVRGWEVYYRPINGTSVCGYWSDLKCWFAAGPAEEIPRASEDECRQACEDYIKEHGLIFTGVYPVKPTAVPLPEYNPADEDELEPLGDIPP